MKRLGIGRILGLTFHSLRHHRPTSKTDLEYCKDPGIFMISLILSIRSRDVFVNQWVREHIDHLSIETMGNYSLEKIRNLTRAFGLGTKADTIYNLIRMLRGNDLDNFDGNKCRQVKGIGTKIGRVFSSIYLKEYSVAVDTHTRKMFNRLSNQDWDVNRIDKYLNRIIKDEFYREWVHIVLVRGSKNGYWCYHDCITCAKIKKLLLL